MDGSYTAINKLTQQSIYAIEHLNLGKPHRRHLGIARLVIAPPHSNGHSGALHLGKKCPKPSGQGSRGFRPECDIRENFDTNECPNIFVSTKLHEWISEYIHINLLTNECPNKYSYWKLHEYSNIFKYSSRFYTLTHSPTNVWIYSYKQIWHERMSEYIRKRKIDMNECPNIYSWPIYSNIRILEYIRHTLVYILYQKNYIEL